MTLNKDLFGKIPVTPATKNSIPVKSLKPASGESVFHGSKKEPDDFMLAPLLHVGNVEQAANVVNPNWESKTHRISEDEEEFLYDSAEDVPGVHELRISKHAKIHPVTVPDDIANEAQRHFLQEKGLEVPGNTIVSSSYHGKEHPLVKSALNALKQNKIVPYINEYETGDISWADDDRSAYNASVSYLVPAPHMNLVQFGQPEHRIQPSLPMDYTGVLPESKTTKHQKLMKDLIPLLEERKKNKDS
jgi:hypothetical protein